MATHAELRSQWLASRSPEDEAAFLRSCLITGSLPASRVELAAKLAHSPAKLALGWSEPSSVEAVIDSLDQIASSNQFKDRHECVLVLVELSDEMRDICTELYGPLLREFTEAHERCRLWLSSNTVALAPELRRTARSLFEAGRRGQSDVAAFSRGGSDSYYWLVAETCCVASHQEFSTAWQTGLTQVFAVDLLEKDTESKSHSAKLVSRARQVSVGLPAPSDSRSALVTLGLARLHRVYIPQLLNEST